MKHIFVVNPAAGKESAAEFIKNEIAKYPAYDCEVYETHESHDATTFIREYCKAHSEPVRFYACGGDGTINEVAQGVFGFPHASMSCYPCGSGNDFVKYYGGREVFLNMEALLSAEATPVDIMRVNDQIAINVTNFGFDNTAARIMSKVKKMPIIGGKMSYYTGVLVAIITTMKTKCKVIVDGELLNPSGVMLLGTVACGKYYGGAFCCAPKSDNTDGLLDVGMACPISRLKLVSLVKSYAKGKHLEDPRFKKVFTYRRGTKVELEAEKGFAVTIDGEIVEGNHFSIEIIPGGISFAVPDCDSKGVKHSQAEAVGV